MKDEEDDDHNSDCKKIITTLSKRSGVQKDIIKKTIIKFTPLVNRIKRETIVTVSKKLFTTNTKTTLKHILPIREKITSQSKLTTNSNHLLPGNN